MKPISMQTIKSGQFESIGHLGDTLSVKFKNGGTYHYHGVSATQFADLQKADSLGKHFSEHIKKQHKFTKFEVKK